MRPELLALLLLALLAGCSRSSDAGSADAGLASCLERPDALAHPPAGQLPCELLPPGFHAN